MHVYSLDALYMAVCHISVLLAFCMFEALYKRSNSFHLAIPKVPKQSSNCYFSKAGGKVQNIYYHLQGEDEMKTHLLIHKSTSSVWRHSDKLLLRSHLFPFLLPLNFFHAFSLWVKWQASYQCEYFLMRGQLIGPNSIFGQL